ncbi:Retrovirus-related Pol polyprotein from transposon 17.6 [Cucumispora dikerogammari]|nr:Retrovirus-related Pol polyprotein from transposon 17.6 [Cucumispora dikerogammari]
MYKKIQEENFTWPEKDQEQINVIKHIWKSSLELATPDMNERFPLETDASNEILAAVLTQDQRPKTYMSRLLKKTKVKILDYREREAGSNVGHEKNRVLLKRARIRPVYRPQTSNRDQKKENIRVAEKTTIFDLIANFTFKTLRCKENQR